MLLHNSFFTRYMDIKSRKSLVFWNPDYIKIFSSVKHLQFSGSNVCFDMILPKPEDSEGGEVAMMDFNGVPVKRVSTSE